MPGNNEIEQNIDLFSNLIPASSIHLNDARMDKPQMLTDASIDIDIN